MVRWMRRRARAGRVAAWARVLAVLVGLAVGTLWAREARAQFFGAMMNEAGMDASITRRGLEAYAKILGLDGDQKDAAKSLMEGNRAANKSMREELEEKMKQLQEKAKDTQDWSIFQKEMPAMVRDSQTKAEKIEKDFFNDLKALLTPEQDAKWVKVERHRRRETLLKFSLVSGMSIDLLDALEKTKVDVAKNTELTETVERYESDLDKALVSFKTSAEASQKKAMDDMANFNPQKWEDMIKDVQTAGRTMRDLHRDYARRITPLLPEDARPLFNAEIKRRSFPKVYRESYTGKCLAAAVKFPDLDASQKEALPALKTTYDRDLTAANEKWATAIETQEEKVGGKLSVWMKSWMGGAEGKEEVAEASKARKELDTSTLDRLKGLLRDEQKSKLPTKTAEKTGAGWDFSAEFMVDGGEDEEK